MIRDEISRLIAACSEDCVLRCSLLATKNCADPVQSFCDICNSAGYALTPGELFAYGMDMNDSKLRATNGGGSFEIDGWDDVYENILDELEGL